MTLIESLIPLFAAGSATGETQANPTGDLLKTVGLMAGMVFVFYYIAIRPQSLKSKQHTEMLKTIRAGDKVVTNGGLLGVVLTVKEKSISVRSGESKLEFQKGAIAEVLERGSEASPS